MPVTILCVGKLRERFYADAVLEYQKRLSRLMPLQIIEVADEPEPASPSDALVEKTLQREGERLLKRLDPRAHAIALCVNARQPTSEELADELRALFISGQSEIAFIIGGSLGLHRAVLDRADARMGLSRMTLPHQLARVVLVEQLFRAAKINANERYHK